MRILIVSVTAGYGHTSAALAAADGLRRRGHTAEVADLYAGSSRFMYARTGSGYLALIRLLPRTFGGIYDALEKRRGARRFFDPFTHDSAIARRFKAQTDSFAPDAVIATHVFAARVLCRMKRRGELSCPIVGVNTDYCIHPFWEEAEELSALVLASDGMRREARERGIAAEKVFCPGIPIRAAFERRLPAPDARRRLGLPESPPTVLLIGGSMGYGKIPAALRALDGALTGAQLICLCGSNERLLKQLRQQRFKNLVVPVGFTEQVELYMDAADCIVTKPGGLTLSECLSRARPLVLTAPIPGPEQRNLRFLVQGGCAADAAELRRLPEAVERALFDESYKAAQLAAIAAVAPSGAAAGVAELVERLREPLNKSPHAP